MGKKPIGKTVGKPPEKPAEKPAEKPGGIDWCKYCEKHIPLGEWLNLRQALLKHQWLVHKVEMKARNKELLQKANDVKRKKKEEAAKAAPPSDPGKKPEGDGHKKGGEWKEGGELTSLRQPTAGAVQFFMGKEEIVLSPSDLYDTYLYYRDMVTNFGIHDDFTTVIKDCVKYAWRVFKNQAIEQQPKDVAFILKRQGG